MFLFFNTYFVIICTANGKRLNMSDRVSTDMRGKWLIQTLKYQPQRAVRFLFLFFLRFLFHSVQPRSLFMNMYKGCERAVKQFILLQIFNKWTLKHEALPCDAIRNFIESSTHSQRDCPRVKLLLLLLIDDL